MKRKFKLITSIASLTAAVALLAVGAFAAGSREVNVSGTVSFTATNVNALVEVFQTTGNDAYGDAILTLDYDIEGNLEATGFETGTGDYDKYTATGLLNNILNDSVLVYKYKIVITNRMETSPITIAYTNSYAAPNKVDWVTETVGDENDTTTVGVGENNVVTLEFTYEVAPNSAPKSGTFPVGGTLTLTRA